MRRRVYAKMEVLVGIDYDDDNDEDEVLANAAEALSNIRIVESQQAFTSPMIAFEDRNGRPAQGISLDLPERIDTDHLNIEELA